MTLTNVVGNVVRTMMDDFASKHNRSGSLFDGGSILNDKQCDKRAMEVLNTNNKSGTRVVDDGLDHEVHSSEVEGSQCHSEEASTNKMVKEQSPLERRPVNFVRSWKEFKDDNV